ncbi:unnamed protein product (macronuclear) [Paramecium tetraurelia]|uniref:UBR-type domain-containing protein n=1 Tax=Paramecium tetraurelia TaxID=5888 RepID=A0BC80_PARTE|nr:uncharacterized protein GSPATT00004241001 [Paramecium tetraurelia]CAK56147.1 unnamed protein product [Paramecium tetraurelia]|eukprot:XP_001423545.1 hypothetical protein (macronuclear) [Paramecium tetraurelia strain d4-2]
MFLSPQGIGHNQQIFIFMKSLIEKIDQRCNLHDEDLEVQDIIAKFITKQQSHLNFIQESQVPNYQCQNKLENGQIVFQCFTCSQNVNHVICQECFDFKSHTGHQFVPTTTNTGGQCDCGNSDVLQQSLCNTHNKEQQQGINQNLQIPKDLCQNLENFIRACATLYDQYSKQILKQQNQFPETAVKLYRFSLDFDLPNLKKLIESKLQIATYITLLSKCQFLFEVFYLALEYFINDNPTLQHFVTYLLQLPLQPDSQQTILESIIQSYAISEPIFQLFDLSIDLTELIYRLFKNQFKQLFTQLCLKKQQSLVSYHKVIVTPNNDIIRELINDIYNSIQDDEDFIIQDDNTIQDIMNQAEHYFQALFTSKLISVEARDSQLLTWITSFQDKQILEEFIFGNYTFELFKAIQKQYQYFHQANEYIISAPVQPLEFIDTQLQQKDFGELCMIQLQQIFGKDFNYFLNQNVNQKFLRNYQMNDHIITTLINSLSEAFPAVYESYKQENNIPLNAYTKEDMKIYINYQGYALDIVNLSIQNLFQSKLSTKQFQKNFIDLLIVKCYNFIKLKRNIFSSFDFEIKKLYNQYLNNLNQTNDQKSIIIISMCLHLFKNASLLDKMFIIFLYVHFCQKEYKNPADFRQYLSELLEEPIEIIKNNLQKILLRCIQTFTTVFYTQDAEIINNYYGFSETSISFKSESIDTAYGKLYLFLFDQIGLTDIYQAFQVIQLPTMVQTCEITYDYFMRMMTSDMDVFNICITYFDKTDSLPNILQQALQKTIQNILCSSSYYLYSTIINKFQSIGIQVTSNLEKHILKICNFDTSINKLTLNKAYQQIYDPNLLILDKNFKAVLIEKLQNSQATQRMLTFGNGLEYDIQQFNQPDYQYLRKLILQVISSVPSLFQSFNLINSGLIETETFLQFIYYQLMCANYFYNQELKAQTQNILNQLHNLKGNQRLQGLQHHFEQLILLLQKQSFNGDIPNLSFSNISKQKAQKSKSYYKLKYDKLKTSKSLLNLMNQHFPSDSKLQQCDFCLQEVQSNKVLLIFLSNRIHSINYSIVPQLIEEAQNTTNYSPTISIQNCYHKYHAHCFEEAFQDILNNKSQGIPEWQKYACPICLHCFNVQITINEDISPSQLQSFNQSLLFIVKQLGEQQAIVQKYQSNEFYMLVEIYMQILINLIQNLFINVQEFQRLQQHLILKQLIVFLGLTIDNFKVCGFIHDIDYQFQSDKSILINLLDAIDKHILKASNKTLLQAEVLKLATKFQHSYSQQMEILCQCFGVEIEKNNNQQLQLQDKFAEYYVILQNQLRNQIINVLGDNFQKFHDTFFPKLCHYCKSYNEQFSDDILVCVLCSKVFCFKNCSNFEYGNLNMHALEEHNSSSFYVSLISGKLTQIQVPHGNYSQRILYSNKRNGNPIRNESYNLLNGNWKDFEISQIRIKEIADVIVYNNYQTGFALLQISADHFYYQGEL